MCDVLSRIDTVLRQLHREVWVVTAQANDQRGGLLATLVAAASIDPAEPVLLLGIAQNHFTRELIDASGACALHLLRPDQIRTAWNFANGSGRDRDKLAGLACRTRRSGALVLEDCWAWLDARVLDAHNTGDRRYYWVEVIEGDRCPVAGSAMQPSDGGSDLKRGLNLDLIRGPHDSPVDGRPLSDGAFFAGLSEAEREQLRRHWEYDVAVQRPLRAPWRASCQERRNRRASSPLGE